MQRSAWCEHEAEGPDILGIDRRQYPAGFPGMDDRTLASGDAQQDGDRQLDPGWRTFAAISIIRRIGPFADLFQGDVVARFETHIGDGKAEISKFFQLGRALAPMPLVLA